MSERWNGTTKTRPYSLDRRRKWRPNRSESPPLRLFVLFIIVLFVFYFDDRSSSFKNRHIKRPIDHEGDKSMHYFKLREEYDNLLQYKSVEDLQRMKQLVRSLSRYTYQNMKNEITYDVHNCPDEPAPNYPRSWNIFKVKKNWPFDDMDFPNIHRKIFQSLCVFDYENEYDKALNYRKSEVPFIIRNDPRVLRTVERWHQPGYISKLMGQTKYPVEHSFNNHFLYWDKKLGQRLASVDIYESNKASYANLRPATRWKQPTSEVYMTFDEWFPHTVNNTNTEYFYLRLIGCGLGLGRHCARPSAEFLFDELPFFRRDTNRTNLYLIAPNEQRGIHCRFAMRGIISESHYDDSRNFIVLLGGGRRRYILAHPNQCQNMYLFPKDHPSARQSSVNWSYPDLEAHPNFQSVMVNEVVLQPGDMLYLPTDWFHYIISLDYTIQCNTRSGRSDDYLHFIRRCGF